MSTTVTHGFRLSTQQKRLWALSSQSDVYRVQALVLFDTDVNAAAVREAIARVIARHDILRTVFLREPGFKTPIQVIVDQKLSVVRTVDISAADDAAALDELASADLREPIDSSQGPLHRFTIVRGTGKTNLIVTLSALCADERSLENLAREIIDCCGRTTGDVTDPDDGVLQVLAIHRMAARIAERRGRWRQFLAGPARGVCTRPDRCAGRCGPCTVRAAACRTFSRRRHDRAHRDLAQRHGVGISAVLLTCWQTLHGRATGEGTVVCGVFGHGRK